MKSQPGYSLFEVLVAFAIMATILAVLLPRQAEMQARVRAIDARALALDYAMSRAAVLEVTQSEGLGHWVTTYRDWTVTETRETVVPVGTDIPLLQVSVLIEDARGQTLATHHQRTVPDERP